MIRPQNNTFRKAVEYSGPWDFRKDPGNHGLRKGWSKGFKKEKSLRVPASWNEQAPDLWDYLGPAWYQKNFSYTPSPKQGKSFIRFGSVNYHATVWINGRKLGTHEGGHLPFDFEITQVLKKGANRLVVRVEGLLKPNRVPPGNVPFDPRDAFANSFNPPASFDFFPYCGIQRPVTLFTIPEKGIRDLSVTTRLQGRDGKVSVKVESDALSGASVRLTLAGFGAKASLQAPLASGKGEALLTLPKARLWAPSSPNLYSLKVELLRHGKAVDQVELSVGIRTMRVQGGRLLLNGKPIFLKGFGRHEDYPGFGRYLPPKILKKDFALMKSLGANSFRTSHYPYSEETLDLADRLGFLVIDETPAVGLFFKKEGLSRRLQLCRQFTADMIRRDRNHSCVIAWSLANEPHSKRPGATAFFKNLTGLAR
ncbi:MAG TPA: glycoside hydrolase family 2 TIM barrel-domain containing protein, partial [bacterium]|nr:glycoside hydrolase family 2 TIM barrel-domain containing protein [bacterium]